MVAVSIRDTTNLASNPLSTDTTRANDSFGGGAGGSDGRGSLAGADGPHTVPAAHTTLEEETSMNGPLLEFAQSWVEITVADGGEGMSPEAVKKLFRPFSCVVRPRPRATAAPRSFAERQAWAMTTTTLSFS